VLDFRDTTALLGASFLVVGVGMVWVPLAPIVTGLLLLGFAIWGHINEPASTTDRDAEAGQDDELRTPD
jgi:CHASE2 domain-containing sensor protein